MEQTPSQCGHCGADTTRDRAAGLTYCSGCGRGWVPDPSVANEQPTTPLDADDAADRRRWMICFWLCFLLTPAATMLAGAGIPWLIRLMPGSGNRLAQMFGVYAVMGMFAAGTLSTAYCLLRIKNEKLDRAEIVARLILYAVALVFAYIGILFVGCGMIGVFIR